jgi:hydroxymethylpyrimidine kinase/phosphomethylpyrimidine kinase
MLRWNTPIALTIAGSDSGGEAGIQADVRTFTRLSLHVVTAITCLTAQNPGKISRVEPCPPKMVRAQLEAIMARYSPKAAKTGMLYSAAIVREVVHFFKRHPEIPLVVDPVIISTSGRQLLEADGVTALKGELLPLATLTTPNIAEAEVLLDIKIRSLADMRTAAKSIYQTYGCAALVKGGHMNEGNIAVDFLYGSDGEWMLQAPRVKRIRLHGTGCTYSAAIAAWLARGKSLPNAVALAKQYISDAICEACT